MLNWREVPFFRILIPFIIGIGLQLHLNLNLPFNNYLLLLLVAFFAIAAFKKIKFQWQWISGLMVNSFFLLLGFQLSYYNNDLNNANHFRKYLKKENLFIGTISNSPLHNDRSIQVDLEIQKIGASTDMLFDCSGTLMLRLRNDTTNQALSYGDVLVVKGSAHAVRSFNNPEAFDFKEYLHFKNIHYQSFLKSEQWQKVGEGQGNPILSWAFKAKAHLVHILKNNLGFKNEYAVASALILGYKEALSEELKNAYSNTGAMHVLAVSGLHAGLIWGIIAFLLKQIRWRHPAWHWIKTGITISCLWIFALITGASPSVLRAATMFTFLLLGIALNRSTNIYNTLAASAFCLLLFNPYLIMEVGFQLSYLAVLGIVYFYKKIYNLWYIENKIGDYLWKLSAVAIAAQLTTFPISMYYFHQFPIYFLLSGIIVVPAAFLILGTGLSLFLVDTVIPVLSPFVAKVLLGIIWLMNALVFLIEQLPNGFLSDVWIDFGTMILLYLFLLSISIAIQFKQFKGIIFAMSFLLLISINYAVKKYKYANQRSIVFYHLPGKSYVEFVDGKKVKAFGDREINEKNLKFASHSFHIKHGLGTPDRFHFGNKNVKQENWFIQNSFLQFYDKKLVFVDRLPTDFPKEKIKVDFVVFRKWSKVTIEDLIQYIDFEKIIFDAALNKNRLLKLKQECHEMNISYVDLNEEGALIVDLKK